MNRLRITPIGTCRIHTPLKRAAARYPIDVDLRRNYGFVHTTGEALQLIQFLSGQLNPPSQVRPLIARDGNLDALAKEKWDIADLHLVEISSAKRVSCGGYAIQLNYLSTHFADFFASPERARQFWSLLKNHGRKELVEFLGAQRAFRMLCREDRELLLSISVEQQTFGSVKSDLAQIAERLDADRLIIVTHANARTPDGSVLASRDRLIRWVKLASRELKLRCFDPTEHLHSFGQERALEQDGLDLTHYTPAFADQLYDALHSSHVATMVGEFSDSAVDDPDRQIANLAMHLEAMLELGDFFAASREVHEQLRKTPEAAPLIHLRGLIRSRLGDYAGALEDLTGGDDTSMSQPVRLALLETLFRCGNDESVLEIAENLIADEFDSPKIYRIASVAAERLGRIDDSISYAKHAFRDDRRDFDTALRALAMIKTRNDPAEVDAWRDEILENVGAFSADPFPVCTAAISIEDEDLFEAAIKGVAASDTQAAIDLVELALEAGLYRAAAITLELLGKAGELPRDRRVRGNAAAVAASEKADALFRGGRPAEAYALARAASGFRPALSRSRTVIREISRERSSAIRNASAGGDHERAVAAGEGLEDLFVGSPQILLVLARSFASLGRNEEAVRLLKKGHQANPEDFVLLRWAARLAAQSGDYATALQMYGSLDRSAPGLEAVRAEIEHFDATVERRALKKLRELLDSEHCEDALELVNELTSRTGTAVACERELERKHRDLRRRLVDIEQGSGDMEEREPMLRMMLRLKPEDPSALRRLALECMRQLNFAEAAECWGALRSLNPDNESAVRNQERCELLARRVSAVFSEVAA